MIVGVIMLALFVILCALIGLLIVVVGLTWLAGRFMNVVEKRRETAGDA